MNKKTLGKGAEILLSSVSFHRLQTAQTPQSPQFRNQTSKKTI